MFVSTGVWRPDFRAALIGFAVFILVVFGVPLVGTFVASLGPSQLLEERSSPFFAYEGVLVFAVGVVTGMVIRRRSQSAIVTGAVVGLFGKLALVLVAALAGYVTFEGGVLFKLLLGVLGSVLLCAMGCVCANRLLGREGGL